MIFIWYGNVYTYASQLINYSYCLVFFCLSVIYIMYSLLSTDTSFEMGKKEVKKRRKGRISWHLSLWLQKSEWGKNFIILASDRKCETQWQRKRMRTFFPSPPQFHVSLAAKQKKRNSVDHTIYNTHTCTDPISLMNSATDHQLSFLFSVGLTP